MRVVRVGAMAVVLACVGAVASAATVLQFSNEELTRRAEVILHGRCTQVTPKAGEGSIIVSEYEFQVHEFLKGAPAGDAKTFRFRALGGTLDGRTFQISGSPTYAVDEEVVLFLDAVHPKTQCRHAIGLAQGKFTVREEAESKKKYLVRDLGGLELTDAGGKVVKVVKEGALEAEQDSRLYLEPFLATIKSYVAKK